MRGKSHAAMGRFLLREYMPGVTSACSRAFLIGCIQPDRNPTTYLKGSIRSQWMRGHNYRNACRFMARLAVRLERKPEFTLWDYYCMGKLVHYTMDAFTRPHNTHFPKELSAHRDYEIRLQDYFLDRFRSCAMPAKPYPDSAAKLIRIAHARYMQLPPDIRTDTAYAVAISCRLMQKLTANHPECQ